MNDDAATALLAHAFRHAEAFVQSRQIRQPRPDIAIAELRRRFGRPLPESGRDARSVIDDLVDAAGPGLVGNTGPDFFGWVMGSSCQVGVAADILTSAWGQNAAIYQTAPSAAIAEEVAAGWLLDLLELPRACSVGFTTGATMASFICLAAARSEVLRLQGWNLESDGLAGAPPLRIILSQEAHASIETVLRYLGLGTNQLIRIPTDRQGRMRLPELAAAIRASTRPGIVIAQAGHINSGAFDAFESIASLCRESRSWLHIDGAFGLWARCSTVCRTQTSGVELADSWAVDGHKWLQVPYDSGYAIVRNADAHRRAMSIDASYLNRTPEDGRNPSDFGPELSRRARGFTTWAILQALGRQGVREMVDRHCACARQLARELGNLPGARVLNEVCLNQVAVTFEADIDTDISDRRFTDAIIAELQRENRAFVSGADWAGYRIMRVSIISGDTDARHVSRLVSAVRRAMACVRSSAMTLSNQPDDARKYFSNGR